MDHSFVDTLRQARIEANEQITDLRERAIIIRYIEDALCRTSGVNAGALPPLNKA